MDRQTDGRTDGHWQPAMASNYLMYYVKELEEIRRKATRLSVRRLVTAMTEPMSERQPLFLDKNAKTVERAVERIEH